MTAGPHFEAVRDVIWYPLRIKALGKVKIHKCLKAGTGDIRGTTLAQQWQRNGRHGKLIEEATQGYTEEHLTLVGGGV